MLPLDYFNNYADEEDIADRSYSANWRNYGFQVFEDYLAALASRYKSRPSTILEIGSADGSAMRELTLMGFKVRGIESSVDMFDRAGLERRRIACGDAVQIVKSIQDDSFDAIYETAAQYIKPSLLKNYFRNLSRIVRRDLVIVLHTKDADDADSKPHEHQVNFEPPSFWIDLIESAGFRNMSKDTNPFWFTKDK